MEFRHPARFRLEASLDGVAWRNFNAYPGGEVETGWFGTRAADASPGTDTYEGHAISDSVQGATAHVPVEWDGRSFPMPVFSPQKLRYLRFTATERRELNGKPVAARVRELRAYAESPQQVEQSVTRTYSLDDSLSFLTFRAEVRNNWSGPLRVEILGTVRPSGVRFRVFSTVAPGETRYIERAGIPMKSPRLWWPNGYGEPFLYTAEIQVKVNDQISDLRSFKFGVRKFSTPIDGGLLTLYCNGTRIVAKGGNWGMDDGLKRDTRQTYDDKIRLHAEANMTMIRNWIGMTNHPAFYDACDKYGILVWDDFWLANPVDGPDPNDPALFLENAADKIRRVRSHAALALYCGRNEGDPPPEINAGLQRLTAELDGTRLYFPGSASPPVGSGGGYSLAWPGGNRGVKQYFNDVTSVVLRSERGIPNVPAAESLRKFVAPKNLWPISEVWALHDWTYHMNGPASSYMAALQSYLGGDFEIPEDRVQGQNTDASDPVFAAYKAAVLKMTEDAARAWTFEDFSRAAQMINFENHHGLFDALAARKSNGLLMWMSQSSWPSFMWQTYDWYLDTNGGYFGAKAGNQPTRAVWDPRDDSVRLANATPIHYENVTLRVAVFDLNGRAVTARDYAIESLPSDACGELAARAEFAASPTDLVFLRLTLRDTFGVLLGENTYWHNRKNYQDYRALAALPVADVRVSVSAPETLANGNVRFTLEVTNAGATPSAQTRIRADGSDGSDILPVFYSDNYFTLLPGETKTVTAELAARRADGIRFVLGGWNVRT
jgi:hypothetical protein